MRTRKSFDVDVFASYSKELKSKKKRDEEFRSMLKKINTKIDDLMKQNKDYKIHGNLHGYQCNCNKLEGISFVMSTFGLNKN